MLPMVRPSWFAAQTRDPFTQFRRDMDSVFDRFFGSDGGSLTPAWSSTTFTIWEDEDHYTIEADLPGVAESDVEVTVHNGLLYIRGERKAEEGRNYLYNGRTFGRFEQVVTLPATVEAEGVQASLNNGVLRVVLSKSPESKPKRIAVRAN